MADYLCMSVAARCSAQAQHAEAILSAPSTTTNATSPILRSLGFPLARRFSKHQGGHDIKMRIRIVPAIDDPGKSLIFNIVDRELEVGKTIKFGRLLDRSSPEDVTFKSKVVSRSHCEIWLGDDGKLYLRDTRSSSGTFLNHVRLSGPNQESRPTEIKDGDIVQLGMDFQGGLEEIYRAVKMRFELNPQLRPTTSYSMSAFSNLRSLIEDDDQFEVDECCICLYALAPFQALFVAPCSHTFHFKCIRPLLESYPGFQCPICRTYSDLEASVAIEAEEVIEKYGLKGGKCLAAAADDSGSQQQQQQRSSSSSSDPLSTTLVVSSLSQSPEVSQDPRATCVFNDDQPSSDQPSPQPMQEDDTSRSCSSTSHAERRLTAVGLVDKLKMAFSEKRKPVVTTLPKRNRGRQPSRERYSNSGPSDTSEEEDDYAEEPCSSSPSPSPPHRSNLLSRTTSRHSIAHPPLLADIVEESSR